MVSALLIVAMAVAGLLGIAGCWELLRAPMGGLLAGTFAGRFSLPWEVVVPWELFLRSITSPLLLSVRSL